MLSRSPSILRGFNLMRFRRASAILLHQPVLKCLTDPVIEPESFASPALSNGLLYLRNERVLNEEGKEVRRGRIVCFDLRKATHPASPNRGKISSAIPGQAASRGVFEKV
jgi:hypothetical protein